jgi:mannose-6-phosphate isomerase-like protein (cupin superfamily)
MSDNRILTPWGYYEVLDEGKDYKVKKLTIFPRQRISLQYHKKRDEDWIFIDGRGDVNISQFYFDTMDKKSFWIRRGETHRITNKDRMNLILIEVQTGICDENDIVRVDDDYNRI